ncbi:MAG: LamG domain-containing protein [Candidatus Aminicenantes bacterium]|nr:LamG domain-containing protein [Candidatus Aminicenantes bacterium]
MNKTRGWIFGLTAAVFAFLGAGRSGQDEAPASHWTFDAGSKETVEGRFQFVPGVAGTGLKFDGYTTRVVRKASAAPRLGEAFTLEAWVAMAALPWNWCPVLSQERGGLVGYSFGIGPRGEFGLKVSVRGVWRECVSSSLIPVRTWAHLAAVFDAQSGIRLYLNGREAGVLPFQGKAAYAGGADLVVGMNPEKRKPSDIVGAGAGTVEGWYAFDGIMDEIKVFTRAFAAGEVGRAHEAAPFPAPPDLPARRLPSGPSGPGRFGAYYAKLAYDESWDGLWPAGPAADVVVEFDGSPVRVVFWRGTRYGPAWVMENGQWIVDQSLETWNDEEGCFEHMEDPRCLYSHVRILESTEARAVVHWRYAPVSSRNHFVGFEETSGWGLWVDEYYSFYPDRTAVRKVVWPSRFLGPNTPSQLQETIPLTQPGEEVGDILHPEAITVLNLNGESQSYSWPGPMDDPGLWRNLKPESPNIQVVNLKSRAKPYIVFEPGCRMRVYVGRVRKSVADFSAYNHFPVSLLPSDGRFAVASDKVASFSISNTSPPRHEGPESTAWAAWVYGVTEDASGKELPAVGRSWARAPELAVVGRGVVSEGYDLSTRSYVLACRDFGRPVRAAFELQASEDRPLRNIVLLLKGWGGGGVAAEVDGQPLVPGPAFRTGHVRASGRTDLVVWVQKSAVKPVRVDLAPR